jgi:hypothetical protein
MLIISEQSTEKIKGFKQRNTFSELKSTFAGDLNGYAGQPSIF